MARKSAAVKSSAETETKQKKTKSETKTSKSSKGKALVIVESPAKSKTIKKILGDDYQIEASYGHIRDFPPKVLGFDVNHDFEPSFIVIPEKKQVVKKLNELIEKIKEQM